MFKFCESLFGEIKKKNTEIDSTVARNESNRF